MDRYRMGEFWLDRNPFSGDLLLLVDGPTSYKSILSQAFSHMYFSRTFEDRNGRQDQDHRPTIRHYIQRQMFGDKRP